MAKNTDNDPPNLPQAQPSSSLSWAPSSGGGQPGPSICPQPTCRPAESGWVAWEAERALFLQQPGQAAVTSGAEGNNPLFFLLPPLLIAHP